MRSGEGTRRAVRGFSYLGLLALLALQGAALAALGRHVATAVQRDREVELRFRGGQIREAIEGFVRAQQPAQWPTSLQELLRDERSQPPRHHLRQLWTDPFTGRTDWVELRDPDTGALQGVRSRSPAPRLTLDGTPAQGPTPGVGDWVFLALVQTQDEAGEASRGSGDLQAPP